MDDVSRGTPRNCTEPACLPAGSVIVLVVRMSSVTRLKGSSVATPTQSSIPLLKTEYLIVAMLFPFSKTVDAARIHLPEQA